MKAKVWDLPCDIWTEIRYSRAGWWMYFRIKETREGKVGPLQAFFAGAFVFAAGVFLGTCL